MAIVCFAASVSYKNGEITIGMITGFLLYMRNFQEIVAAITNNIQTIAKVFGAAYDISVMIVTPNKISNSGSKTIGEETDDEAGDSSVVEFENVAFNYPSKPDVQVLSNVSI